MKHLVGFQAFYGSKKPDRLLSQFGSFKNSSHGAAERHKIRRYPDFEALQFQKNRSGVCATFRIGRATGSTMNRELKRLHKKELSSRPVFVNFHGLNTLCLSYRKLMRRKTINISLSPFLRLQTLTAEGRSQLFLM